MIRGIMKEKGVSSLEELIDSARSHGVRKVTFRFPQKNIFTFLLTHELNSDINIST